MGSQAPEDFDVKKIAIIGAGPCGLAAAKYLLAQDAFESITIYEQQDEVGGVWYYSPSPSETLHVPQVSAFCPPDPPLLRPPEPPIFPTPMYDVLHTNIPRDLMQFSDLPFPLDGEGDGDGDGLIFPHRRAVQAYLRDYSREIRHLIRFSTQVRDVRLRQEEDGRDRWDLDAVPVSVSSVASGDGDGDGDGDGGGGGDGGDDVATTESFDAVVVASGHYATTYVPAIRGIEAFHQAHPGVITHSKLYRRSDAFRRKKVIVVGNAASGLDIAAQIGGASSRRVLLSVREPSSPENLAYCGAQEVPEIDEFLVEGRGVRFRNGRVEQDVDAVIFCTGYLYTFPFLTSLAPPLVTNGRRVYGLWRDLFHIEHPTLVFPGLPIKVVPFPLSESQAAIFARVWANELPLPPQKDMKKWEEDQERERGPAFHVFPKGGDIDYINRMHDWVVLSLTPGKMPPKWDDELIWQRQIYAEAKLKFEMQGRKARSLEELGFVYQPGERETDMPEVL